MTHNDLITSSLHVELAYLTCLKKCTPAQLLQRKDKDSWSVIEILEHICLVEEKRNSMIVDALNNHHHNTPSNQQNTETPTTLYQLTTQRGTKINAPDYSVPKGKIINVATGLLLFLEYRHILKAALMAHSMDDIVNTHLDHARLGSMNVAQWVFYLNGHVQRHLEQTQEIIQRTT